MTATSEDSPVTPTLWRAEAPLVLASTSPTRLALLVGAGLPVETRAPDVDERALEAKAAGLAPDALALHLAAAKAESVARDVPDRIVIGADQVLDLDGQVLHKPRDQEDARAHLARLSGRPHALHAAVALAEGGQVVERFVVTAQLTMRALDAQAIAAYVALAGDAVTGSVGAYQLEGLGIHLFEAVAGDHPTILGLPLIPLLGALRTRGHLGL
jgi:septum formation protein